MFTFSQIGHSTSLVLHSIWSHSCIETRLILIKTKLIPPKRAGSVCNVLGWFMLKQHDGTVFTWEQTVLLHISHIRALPFGGNRAVFCFYLAAQENTVHKWSFVYVWSKSILRVITLSVNSHLIWTQMHFRSSKTKSTASIKPIQYQNHKPLMCLGGWKLLQICKIASLPFPSILCICVCVCERECVVVCVCVSMPDACD